jgi:hypothetical protein
LLIVTRLDRRAQRGSVKVLHLLAVEVAIRSALRAFGTLWSRSFSEILGKGHT